MMARLSTNFMLTSLAAVALSGCAATGSRPQTVQAPVQRADAERVQYLLLQGESGEGKKLLKKLLKQEPMNPSLLLLQQSVELKPEELLGPKSYSYKVKPGETIGGIADRLLGNELKAYQLARYNGLTTPVRLAAGQTLRIPGDPIIPKAPPPPRPAPSPDKGHAKPKESGGSTKASTNPAAAQRARSAGLAALNRGKPELAVSHLKRALALDPRNQLIARDLQRAQRISATVNQKK